MKIFGKTAYVIRKLRKKYVQNVYQTVFLITFWYHKHELEIARFVARTPCAGAVDVKRLISVNKNFTKYQFLKNLKMILAV